MNQAPAVNQGPVFSVTNLIKDFLSRDRVLVRALDGVSFESGNPAGITCIVGPTGSGKSTILRILSGLEKPDQGGVLVAGSPPAELSGRIAHLTQRTLLFPWMSVHDNIALPFGLKGVPRNEQQEQIARICDQLGLQSAGGLYPYEISGGMQQRAALGRVLASAAPYWLLDEPFNALDERTRHRMQELLIGLVHQRHLSVLFVTHAIDEAVFLADRVVVLSAAPGRVADILDIGMEHPRDRLKPEFGEVMERIRRRIESALKEEK